MRKKMEINILDKKYQDNLKKAIIFEMKSFLGRKFFNSKPKLSNNNYLNLGCGTNIYNDFINADFFCGFQFWKSKQTKPDWMLDLRYKLNCPEEVWDGIFSEHVFEHLYPNQIFKLLNELFRTMKKGATLRIVVPDLQCVSKIYSNSKTKDCTKGAKLIWDLTQNWGHKSVWDYALLKEFLERVGFVEVVKMEFGRGRKSKLLKDSFDRKKNSLYVEAIKPK